MNEITRIEPAVDVEAYRPSAAIDPVRLDYLWTLAERMARTTLVPESLRTTGSKNNKKELEFEAVVANVFAVVEQADRLNVSPFALLACAAIVHGKLGFEGKVIAAVLESTFNINLFHYFTGDPRSDDCRIYLSNKKLPDEVVAELKPGYRHPDFKILDGSVGEWKTTGDGSPWRPVTYLKMLVYRGSREWARVYKPAAILGLLSDDELQEIAMERAAQAATNINPNLSERFGARRTSEGFNPENVKQLTAGGQVPMEIVGNKEQVASEVQHETALKTTPSVKAASAKPASDDAGGGGEQGRPDNSSQPSQDGGDEGGKAQAPSPRLSAETFKKYAGSLARMQTEKNVEKASAQFWTEHGTPKGPDRKLGLAIYDKQIARAKGDIEAEGLLDEIHALIDAEFAGDKL